MGQPSHLKPSQFKPAHPTPATRPAPWRRSAVSTATGLAGALIALAAVLLGAAIAVIFAATLAFVMALASLLLGLAAVAWRMKPRPAARRAEIQMRPGHAWVAYDWDRPST